MITIIDYGLGNLASVANAFAKLEIPYEISSDSSVLKKAKALVLPGVGAAGQGMKNLKDRKLDQIIIEHAKKGTPLLGICLGMQLLLSTSEEGDVACLDLVKGKVKKFNTNMKVPEIGWNEVEMQDAKTTNLLKNIPDNSFFYFVNSYYCEPEDKNVMKGITDYGLSFCSVFEKENILGVQFHPEKSGERGLQLLKNFYLMSFRT